MDVPRGSSMNTMSGRPESGRAVATPRALAAADERRLGIGASSLPCTRATDHTATAHTTVAAADGSHQTVGAAASAPANTPQPRITIGAELTT